MLLALGPCFIGRTSVKAGYGEDNSNMNKVNLSEKLSLITEHWSPRIVGELNGQHVKIVKFQGEFVWHHHEHEDEMFLVIHGSFRMDYRDESGHELAMV